MDNDFLKIRKKLFVNGKELTYYSLKDIEKKGKNIKRLPFSIRILLENAIRNYDAFGITKEHINTILNWGKTDEKKEIPFKPARVLMQDFTGVPAIVDIASLRSEMERKGKDSSKINPLIPVHLVIDHSVQVEYYGTNYSYKKNVELEYKRNKERYQLLKWAQTNLDNFLVVPPGMGICHQINLEYLAKVVIARDNLVFPDTLVGTDSHTPMVNGLGVVAWGVGGIEAEAAILGQPIYFVMPEVIGLKLSGQLPEGTTATDLVLSITKTLRDYGVVGKFVEVFGEGLKYLSIPDRATISNMSPEFGCTVTYFPVDAQTLSYLNLTGRSKENIKLVEKYCKENMLWYESENNIEYSDIIEFDISKIEPSLSGPKRPQDKILLKDIKDKFKQLLKEEYQREYIEFSKRVNGNWYKEGDSKIKHSDQETVEVLSSVKNNLHSVIIKSGNEEYILSDGAITIAAITSCTNTSNPGVMIGAGLLAKNAVERGIKVKPWVKTSLAPGSKVVTDYLKKANLLDKLEALNFHVVGYGCTTCIGNSGNLLPHISKAINENDLVVVSVLSGNRNFEARIHPQIKMNFLASPILVVAYAIAGRIDIDFKTEPIAYDPNMEPVYLKDIWPSQEEINNVFNKVVTPENYYHTYSTIFKGDDKWKNLNAPDTKSYKWEENSTYIKEPPFFINLSKNPKPLTNINNARILLLLGDSVTTDHISPAGTIAKDSPAGKYLIEHGVDVKMFNSYGSRRGNHEVMMRGTFANLRLKNKLVNKEGGWTIYHPTGEEMTVFDAAMKYKSNNIPLIVVAGKEYGSGSSRDWAAKGTNLLGIKAIIAESYERIHRSNLVGMGVLPLMFKEGENAESLKLTGKEELNIIGIEEGLIPHKELTVKVKGNNNTKEFKVIARLDSEIEVAYCQNGGILHYVLRNFLKN